MAEVAPIYQNLSRSDLHAVEPMADTQSVQGQAEGVIEPEDGRIPFMGERFRLAERVGIMPMLAYANSSKQGADSDDMEGLAAMYALIRDVVDQTRPPKIDPATGQQLIDSAGQPEWDGPSEWMRFERHAMDVQADGEEIMEFVGRAMEVLAARPRKRREVSSTSSPRTSETSRPDSFSRGTPQADGLVPVSALGH